MSLKNAIGAASLTVLLASTAAYAQSGSQYDGTPAPSAQSCARHSKLGMHLSPEEKAMLKLNWRQQLKSVPADQRKEAKQQLKQNWRAMNPHVKQQQLAQLDNQWRQLPQSTRDAALERLQRHAQRKMQNRQSQGGYDGAPYYRDKSAGSGTPD